MPDEVTYYGIHKASGRRLKWTLVQTITYDNETVYDGDTHNFEFDLSNAIADNGYLEEAGGANVMPDSVANIDPRHTAKKRSIIILTCTKGVGTISIKIYRDQLAGGCIYNIDPWDLTAVANTYYAVLRNSNRVVAFGLVSSIAYGNEDIYDNDLHTFEFDLSNAQSGKGWLDNADTVTKVSPDSIAKQAPEATLKKVSIITLTVTHGGTTMDLRMIRDQFVGGGLQNSSPLA